MDIWPGLDRAICIDCHFSLVNMAGETPNWSKGDCLVADSTNIERRLVLGIFWFAPNRMGAGRNECSADYAFNDNKVFQTNQAVGR